MRRDIHETSYIATYVRAIHLDPFPRRHYVTRELRVVCELHQYIDNCSIRKVQENHLVYCYMQV